MILTLLTTFLILDAVVLFFLVLVFQHGNEGGLGGSLGGGNSTGMFGASGGVKFITRATWICGALFFILALSTSWVKTHNRYTMKDDIEKSLLAPSTSESESTESFVTKPEPDTKEPPTKPK